MEMRSTIHTIKKLIRVVLCALLFLLPSYHAPAQEPVKRYTVKNGKMFIEMGRRIREATLDSFITQFNLSDIGLKQFIRRNDDDSLLKMGWQVDFINDDHVLISKPLMGFDPLKTPGDKITFSGQHSNFIGEFPAVSNRWVLGYNRFRNKLPFKTENSVVTFFLRGHQKAQRVKLAGSFNNWDPQSLSMIRTDSGWIANVRLEPGKYWYKFIVDGDWKIDSDNALSENDGRGNTNSIFFRTNYLFSLRSFQNANRVYVSGSFNNWRPRDLAMSKTANGWELPVYLAEGTHTYKFVVDGSWHADPANSEKLPDGVQAFNSVIRLGKPYVFRLNGFTNAKQVMLAGSFNTWRDFELEMQRTATGWELPYTLGPGNHEYRFRVDGKWISDPANPPNPHNKDNKGNSYLVFGANYTFRLQGYPNANTVFLAGDFNNWHPTAYAMKKVGNDWVFPVHLSPGKVRYKFVVDGEWILDPKNKLWEQNEHRTGNSILWIE